MKNNQCGLTLVEILTVCLLLAIVIIGFFYVFHAGFALIEQLSGSVIALNDAGSVIENMRNIDPLDAANLTATYPDATPVGGFNNLLNEVVAVSYQNLAADPIKVYVTVTWQGQSGRVFTEELVTLLTKR